MGGYNFEQMTMDGLLGITILSELIINYIGAGVTGDMGKEHLLKISLNIKLPH